MLAWNRARRVGAVCAASLAMTLVACQGSPNPGSGGPSPGADRSPSGYGVVFLGVDECSSRGRNTFTEVPCRSERAVARVTARYDGKAADGPMCPARTDFVLHLSEDRPPPVGSDGTAAGEIPQGYACMRTWSRRTPGIRGRRRAPHDRRGLRVRGGPRPGPRDRLRRLRRGETPVPGGRRGGRPRRVPCAHGVVRDAGRVRTGGMRGPGVVPAGQGLSFGSGWITDPASPA